MIIDRWHMPVGQGLFTYHEARPNPGIRPFNFIYDAGTSNCDSHTLDDSVAFVRSRIRKAGGIVDFVFISHFHIDHISIISRIIEGFTVRNIVAPLLEPGKDEFEIFLNTMQWTTAGPTPLPAASLLAFLDKGSTGLLNQLLLGTESPATTRMWQVPGVPRDRPEDEQPASEPRPVAEPNDYSPSLTGLSRRQLSEDGYRITWDQSRNLTIGMSGTPHTAPFWKFRIWKQPGNLNNGTARKAEKQLDDLIQQRWSPGETRASVAANLLQELYGNHGLSKHTTLHTPRTVISAAFKSFNASSICLYAGPCLNFHGATGKWNRMLAQPYIKPLHSYKTMKRKSFQIAESATALLGRTQTLQAEFTPVCVSNPSWLGLGDAKLITYTQLDSIINHFKDALPVVGTITVPHHGAETGFKEQGTRNWSKITKLCAMMGPGPLRPRTTPLAIISCKSPGRYAHPRTRSLLSLKQMKMIPTLVDDDSRTAVEEYYERI